MSEQVVSAAPAATENASSSNEVVETSQENQESSELEAQEQESSEETSDEVEASSEEKPKKEDNKKSKAEKELEKRIKKLKLKVDGREIEEEIDLDDEERLVRELQMAKMGQKRAQEKAELENELRKFMQALQDDPLALLAQEFKMNPEELIESYINKQLEQAKKTPEQIEKEKLEMELKRLQEERKREQEEIQRRELERLQQQEFERYDMLMEQAFAKHSIPKSPYSVKKFADYMLVALEAGYDVSPEDVAPLVEEELSSDLNELFQSLPEERIEKLLGDQVINRLRKRRVAKAQEAQKAVAKPKIPETGKDSKTELDKTSKEKKTFRDFFGV